MKIRLQFINKPAQRQTDRQTDERTNQHKDITSLAAVKFAKARISGDILIQSIINSNHLITIMLKNFSDLQGVTVWLVFLCSCLYLLHTLLFIMIVFYSWSSVLRRVIGLSDVLLIFMCSFFIFSYFNGAMPICILYFYYGLVSEINMDGWMDMQPSERPVPDNDPLYPPTHSRTLYRFNTERSVHCLRLIVAFTHRRRQQ